MPLAGTPTLDISIHALRKESDPEHQNPKERERNFNPRSP